MRPRLISRCPDGSIMGKGTWREIYRPVVETPRWTAGSRLSAVARDLIAAGRGQPPLDELNVARFPLNPAPLVSSVEAAITAIAAARTWMWHNPAQLTGAHLQLGTQLGLAVHVLTSAGDPQMVGGWRQAAIAAGEIRATPPVGPARDAAAELAEVLRWLRPQASAGCSDSAVPPDQRIARLNAELPFMAATLHKGLAAALQRRELFVRAESSLTGQAGSLVFRTTERWRPAVSDDDVVQDLTRALLPRQEANDDGGQRGAAARAFPRPPRPRPSMPQQSLAVTVDPTAVRDRYRSR
ncbi:hypothetical protein [Micromonospora purpureochromogenes]|uniref:hypothetical protein n=1 Tax=Micromonospora purpureochromogenes TaxID=47872 RepID=UPI0012FD4EA5|nr:hypothetical protein [Micromonospora purpureochromogenes]